MQIQEDIISRLPSPQAISQEFQLLNNARPYHLVSVVPDSKLTWSDSTLRSIEENIKTVSAHYDCSILERLAVADTHTITADFTWTHGQVRTDPMNFVRGYTKTTAGKALMGMAFTNVYQILLDICLYHEDRILVAADIQALTLTDSIELGSIVFADNLAERIFFIACLLYMLATAAIGLSLESYIIFHRLSKAIKLFICECSYLLK
jgi:hypothetical protein